MVDDRSLLARVHAGDIEGFSEICRSYETRLVRKAMALCGNDSQAEELAQDTFVEAWKSLHRYNGRCQFFTWLCAILLNRYRNLRRQKRPVSISSLAAYDEDQLKIRLERLADPLSVPDQEALAREQAALVLDCVKALPRKHQEVIYLRFYADDSLEGTAAALGCSIGTVKSRLFRALEKLRMMNALNPRTTAANEEL